MPANERSRSRRSRSPMRPRARAPSRTSPPMLVGSITEANSTSRSVAAVFARRCAAAEGVREALRPADGLNHRVGVETRRKRALHDLRPKARDLARARARRHELQQDVVERRLTRRPLLPHGLNRGVNAAGEARALLRDAARCARPGAAPALA